jgi:hypothetical protein
MVAQWVARWGLLVAGLVAVVVTVVEALRARNVTDRSDAESAEGEVATAPIEA